MAIYMKIDGYEGPIKEGKYKGWLELQSAQLTGVTDAKGLPTPEVIATKRKAKDSEDWHRKGFAGGTKDVTIVFVTVEKGSAQEDVRITLSKARPSIYKVSDYDGIVYETFTLRAAKLIWEKGSAAQASLMVRPKDWGSIQATALFQGTALA